MVSSHSYLEAAAYIADMDGLLVNDNSGCSLAVACGQNPVTFAANGGTATVKGVELEFKEDPLGWQLPSASRPCYG